MSEKRFALFPELITLLTSPKTNEVKMKVGNLVQIDLGFGTVEGDPLRCERKFAWGLITEIRREGERLMVHFTKDDREFLIKRSDIKVVVNDNGQILSENNIDK